MAYTFAGYSLNPFARSNTAVINIILLCTITWIATAIVQLFPIGYWVMDRLKLSPDLSELIWQPWTLISYIFLHDGFFHLLFNMLWLFFIGSILEDLTGKKHIWRTFIGGGVLGGLAYLLAANLSSRVGAAGIVGASGGVMAVVVATAVFVPRYRVFLFGILQVELMWIAAFLVFFDLLGIAGSVNQGGYVAHLGGTLFGLLYMLHTKGIFEIPGIDGLANWFGKLRKPKSHLKPVRSARVEIRKPEKPGQSPNQQEIDAILDKINQSGYNSLTKEEKETLFRAGGNP
ncbi:MAG: rhomboid family intramembrane serine protease [Bacteroidetes bacterium]|nr:rhomboid family intramembrane serine protease [Bacteroidota bacterium]